MYCRSKSLVDELRPELPERSKKAQASFSNLHFLHSCVAMVPAVLWAELPKRSKEEQASLGVWSLCADAAAAGVGEQLLLLQPGKACPAVRLGLAGRSQALTRCIACPCLPCAGALLRVPGLVRRWLHPVLR